MTTPMDTAHKSSLDELIESVREGAKEFSDDRGNHALGTYERECIESYQAACDKLIPALKEAVIEAEKFDCGSYVEEAIRRILEAGGA